MDSITNQKVSVNKYVKYGRMNRRKMNIQNWYSVQIICDMSQMWRKYRFW